MGSQNEGKICIDAFDGIVEEYTNPIFCYCFRMLKNSHEAEDAVQEIFIKAYKALAKDSHIVSIVPWLYRIAYNHCLNIIRRRKLFEFINLTEETPSEQVSFEDDIAEGTFSEELKSALSKLSPEQRTAIILRVIEEMEYGEIGAILNKKSENVRKIYERAKKKLQSCWNIEKEVIKCEGNSIL